MKKKTPMTPQQAVNNFKMFLELSPRNSYEEYRAAVRERLVRAQNQRLTKAKK